jgi:hypothetical protein
MMPAMTVLPKGCFLVSAQPLRFTVVVGLVVLASACNVKSTAGEGGAAGPLTECGRGLVVVTSDFNSTNLALTDLAGEPKVGSFLSSGSSKPGLTLAISGDVEVPGDVPPSGQVVVIDRYGSNVLTFADPQSGAVRGQLRVATGFESNPQDYVEVDERLAFVSRYETNSTPGLEPNDEGGDVLVIDTVAPAIESRIAMPAEGAFLPRASGMTRLGDTVWVTLQRLTADFGSTGDGELVAIDVPSRAVRTTLKLPGLKNCGRVTRSPRSVRAVVACSGSYDAAGGRYITEESDLVELDLTGPSPKELRRLGLAAKEGAPLGGQVAFASDDVLLVKSLGALDGARKDRLVQVDLSRDAAPELLLEAANGGSAFGDVRCTCSATCMLADASRGVLDRWRVTPAVDGTEGTGAVRFERLPEVKVDTTVGLPPRLIGGY